MGMGSITLDGDSLRLMNLFETVTQVSAKDCIETEEKIVFIVGRGQLGKAIGKEGKNINHIKKLLNKDVHLIEHSDSPEEFIRNVFSYYDVKKVEIENRGNIVHATVTVDPKNKAKAIGKEGRNLRFSRDIIARHHEVQSVSIA
jgi:N utilization substance protein A